MINLSTNSNEKDSKTFYSTNINDLNETTKISSDLISISTKNISEETHFIETNSELTSDTYNNSINIMDSTNVFKTDKYSWTKTNRLTTDSTENIKESSEIASNSNLNDSYDSSEIFNSESNINIYNKSEVISEISSNIVHGKDINSLLHSTDIENTIIDTSENVFENTTNEENSYISQSIIGTNTNERNTYDNSNVSNGPYSTDFKSESNLEITTDLRTTDNNLSDIISHSSMDINKNTEKYSSEIMSNSQYDSSINTDSTIKTSEIYESSQSTFNSNTSENENSILTESNSIESEMQISSGFDKRKSDYNSEITSTSNVNPDFSSFISDSIGPKSDNELNDS